MKRFFLLMVIFAGTLVATKSYSQVYVHVHRGFRIPAPVIYPPIPRVVYGNGYYDPYYYGGARLGVVPGYGYERYRHDYGRYERRRRRW